MDNYNEFSLATNRYLDCFNEILENMICQMTSARLTHSISYNFMVQMIPHHRAAIEMSNNLLQYTTCIPLQNIALGIIKEQTESIKNMEDILQPCSKLSNSSQSLIHYKQRTNAILEQMFHGMKSACSDNDINISFMREMIPHHKGAIAMAKNTLNYCICPALKPILRSIITSQEKGVCEMEKLLSCIK